MIGSGRVGRRAARLFLTAAAAVAGFACASPGGAPGKGAPEVAIGEEATGSTITVHRGELLVVSLPGNPTTGFVWEIAAPAEGVLEQEGKEFVRGGSALGAGGVYRFVFRGRKSGSGTLRLVCHRPFEKGGAPPASTFQVTVVVAE